MELYTIILADDHTMFRKGVKKILEEREYEIIGEASDGLELLELLKDKTPQLVILDVSMPNLRGIEAIREIKALNPNIKVLMLSMHNDKDYLYHSISSGADGYILKSEADTELFEAIDRVRRGNTYISKALSDEVSGQLARSWQLKTRFVEKDPLTNRERQILKLIAEGNTNKQIAEILYLSVRTVENHRANMMNKLNVKSSTDLVKYAIIKGYVELDA